MSADIMKICRREIKDQCTQIYIDLYTLELTQPTYNFTIVLVAKFPLSFDFVNIIHFNNYRLNYIRLNAISRLFSVVQLLMSCPQCIWNQIIYFILVSSCYCVQNPTHFTINLSRDVSYAIELQVFDAGTSRSRRRRRHQCIKHIGRSVKCPLIYLRHVRGSPVIAAAATTVAQPRIHATSMVRPSGSRSFSPSVRPSVWNNIKNLIN